MSKNKYEYIENAIWMDGWADDGYALAEWLRHEADAVEEAYTDYLAEVGGAE